MIQVLFCNKYILTKRNDKIIFKYENNKIIDNNSDLS